MRLKKTQEGVNVYYEVSKHTWYGDICPYPQKTCKTRFLLLAWIIAYCWSREHDAALVRWRSVKR